MTTVQIVGLVWRVIKFTLNQPLVAKALENWSKGTHNTIDDWVWGLIKEAAGIKDDALRTEKVLAGLSNIQSRYDDMKSEAPGRLDVAKQPLVIWAGEIENMDNIA